MAELFFREVLGIAAAVVWMARSADGALDFYRWWCVGLMARVDGWLVLNPNVATGVKLRNWLGCSIRQSIGAVCELGQGGPSNVLCTEDGKLVRNCINVFTWGETMILISYFCYVSVADSRQKERRKETGGDISTLVPSWATKEEVVGNNCQFLAESVPTQQSTDSFAHHTRDKRRKERESKDITWNNNRNYLM